MMTFLFHWLFELGGSGAWACARGRCSHTHHRVAGDVALTGALTYMMVAVLG